MTLQIRSIDQDEHQEWRTLWTAYLEFYQTQVAEEVYETTFRRLQGGQPYDPRGLIAWLDAKPVGLVHYMFQRHCWKVENVCYLQDLIVLPEARGTGLGRALIEAVYERADAAGCPTVYWTTAEDNAQARKLYDRVAARTPFIKYQR